MSETANWIWQARDGSGELCRGTFAAETAAEVASRLRSEGRTVIAIDRTVEAERAESASRSFVPRRVDREAVASMIRRLSVMLEAGVPLAEALAIETTSTPSLAVEIDEIRLKVEGGMPPSQAFAAYPRIFPPVATGLLRAAEAVGDLPGMLGRLADWMQRERRIARQVRTALAYPILLGVVGTVITLLLVTLVMPRFEAIYAQREATLPPITEFVLAFGRGVMQGWTAWGPVLIVLVFAFPFAIRSTTGRTLLEWMRFELQVISSVIRPADLARGTRGSPAAGCHWNLQRLVALATMESVLGRFGDLGSRRRWSCRAVQIRQSGSDRRPGDGGCRRKVRKASGSSRTSRGRGG